MMEEEYKNEKEIKECKIEINIKKILFLIFINLKRKEHIILNIYLKII